MKRLPVLKALETFTAIAPYPSFTAAGEALGMTHGAIGHQIRSLEAWLGKQVLSRHKEGVKLTPEGEQLLASCTKAFEILEDTIGQIREDDQRFNLSIGCSSSLLAYWLLPRIDAFTQNDPNISLNFQTHSEISALTSRKVDVLITNDLAFSYEGIVATRVRNDRIGPVCSPGWKHLPTKSSDLEKAPLLHATSRTNAWLEWAAVVGANLRDDKPKVFDTLSLSIEAASAGLGFAMTPEFVVRGAIRSGRLVAPLSFVEAGRSTWICSRESDLKAKSIDAFTQWLLEWNALA